MVLLLRLIVDMVLIMQLQLGFLGFTTSDLRVPKAPEIARKRGIDIRFVEEKGEKPDSSSEYSDFGYD